MGVEARYVRPRDSSTPKDAMAKKKIYNLIVVDESGSMAVIQQQAFAGMNETLQTILDMQGKYPDTEQRVTLLLFDSGHQRFLFDNAPAAQVHQLNQGDYRPGGATPLYDAIGLGIAHVNAVCGPEDNVLVTIITDGEENCSTEYNLSMVKNLIEKLKAQHWTFTFIGTDDLNVEGMARAMNIDNSLRFRKTERGTQEMFARLERARKRYNYRKDHNMEESVGAFFDEEGEGGKS